MCRYGPVRAPVSRMPARTFKHPELSSSLHFANFSARLRSAGAFLQSVAMTHRMHLWSVAGAYTLWGILPLYWHLLGEVPGTALVGMRILCSLLLLGFLLYHRGELGTALRELVDRKRLSIVLVSALLVAGNWLIYLWAMTHGKMLDAGLGYFICPVVTMIFGALLLGEDLSRKGVYGALLISIGVLYKIWLMGSFPWVGAGLAGSFAAYLVIRKRWPVSPVKNMFHEMAILAPLGMLLLLLAPWTTVPSLLTTGLLLLSGPVTVIPMLALVFGMQRVSLQTGALLQYINPALTIAMGVMTGETLSAAELLAYGIIGLGIATGAHCPKATATALAHDSRVKGLPKLLSFPIPAPIRIERTRSYRGERKRVVDG